MLILTQSLREACIAEEDVIPCGAFVVSCSDVGEIGAHAFGSMVQHLKQETITHATNNYVVDLVVNVRLTFHESFERRGYTCMMIGDGYVAISQELKEKCK